MKEIEAWERIARALIAKTEQMVGWYKIDPTMPLTEAASFACGFVLGRLSRYETALIELRATRPELKEIIDKVMEV